MSKFAMPAWLFFLLCCACGNPPNSENSSKPLEEKTSTVHSDRATALADSVMTAMGGQDKWEGLHYVSWNFFGARDLVWDKWANRVRIESPRDSSTYVLDLNTMEGQVQRKGQTLSHPDSLSKYLGIAKSIWINDAYWLVMPFKLKDPGVNLKYLRSDTIPGGLAAEVLELTFEEVGDTPNNKYEVYIDRQDMLVKQWAFFRDREQEKASAVWPWDNYKDHNGLLLSDDRSDKRGPFEVKVYETLDDAVFNSLAKVAL